MNGWGTVVVLPPVTCLSPQLSLNEGDTKYSNRHQVVASDLSDRKPKIKSRVKLKLNPIKKPCNFDSHYSTKSKMLRVVFYKSAIVIPGIACTLVPLYEPYCSCHPVILRKASQWCRLGLTRLWLCVING